MRSLPPMPDRERYPLFFDSWLKMVHRRILWMRYRL